MTNLDGVRNVARFLYPENEGPCRRHIGWIELIDEVLKRYGRRTRRIELGLGWRSTDDILPGCLEHPAPSIEVLTVSGPMFKEIDRPPILFGKKVSSLQGLAIVNTVSWLPANDFPRLTHLYLSLIKEVRRESLLQDFMHLLSTASNLRYLYFEQHSWSPAGYTGPKITLPSLRHLSITSKITPLPFYLLDYFDLHDEVLVRFVGQDVHSPDDNQGVALWESPIRPFHAIATITRVELNVNLHSLSLLARDDAKRGALSVWTPHGIDEPSPHTPDPSVDLLAMLSPSSVVHLRVSVVHANMLGAIVALLPHLRVLAVQVCDPSCSETGVDKPPALYSALGGANGQGPLCPELQELAVQGEETYDFFNPTHIIDVAAARLRAGCPIQRLGLQARRTYDMDLAHGRFVEVTPDVGSLSAALSPLMAHGCEYSVELAPPLQEGIPDPPHRFELHELWNDAEAQKYWRLRDIEHEWPSYYIN